jgi:hypothetical protein
MNRALLALVAVLAACSNSTDSSSPPFDLAGATGDYTFTLAVAAQGSFGPSCTPITVTTGAPRSWSGTCINAISADGTVTQVGDTLVLAVTGLGPIGASPRPIKLYTFGGTEAKPMASWDGALCWDNAAIGGCVREHGTAKGHR